MRVDIHRSAKADVAQMLQGQHRRAAIVLIPLIQQLQADDKWAPYLTVRGEFKLGAVRLNVKQWETPKGLSMWRFRALDTHATSYRVVYGKHWERRLIVLLGIVHKDDSDFDYDDLNRPTSARILDDFRAARAAGGLQ